MSFYIRNGVQSVVFKTLWMDQSAPKERRRRRVGKWLPKRVFLESPFLLCPSKVCP